MVNPKRRKKPETPPLDFGIFQEFTETVGAAIVVFSTQREILYMNSHAVEAWGPAEPGAACHRFLRSSREHCQDCAFEEIVKTHRWLRREMRMKTLQGWRTFENLYIYVQGDEPDKRVVVMAGIDVNETRELRKEVLKERELSRALLESVNSVVLGFGTDGDMEFANKAAEAATGYTEREIKRGGGIRLLVPPDAARAAEEYFTRPPDEPRPEEPVLIPVMTRSGARRMISWTYSPLMLDGSGAAGAIALGQDVTERFTIRKEAEKKAAELEVVNSVLARVGAATDFEEMLSISLDELLSLPAYKNGAAFILEAGATEARRVAIRGFRGSGPDEQIAGTQRVFPATAVYNRRIEIAPAGSEMHPHVEEVNRAENNTGMVAIPLFPGGHPLGLVMLGYGGDPTPEEMGMEVLRACAEALELGAENAFLRVRAERRAQEATALLKVNQALTGTTDLTEAMREVAGQIAELLDADVCGMFLFEEDADVIRLAAGYPPDAVGGRPVPDASMRVHKAASEVARTLKPLAIYDVASDDRVPEYVSRDYGIKSSMHVPLIAEGKFTGAIYVAMSSRHRRFTTQEAGLLESFARQTSIAIRNVSLLKDLRESEERYRAIMENSGVGFVVHDGDNVLYANERAARIIGYEGQAFTKISDILQLCPVEDRKRMLDNMSSRLSDEGKAARDYDVRIRRRDGSLAVVHLINTPMTMGGRKVFLVAVSDVTDRVEAEQAVMASEERYRTLIESSRDAIIIAGPKGSILFANSASTKLSGKSAGEMVGDSVYDFVHPDEKDSTRKKFVREWEMGRNVARFPVRTVMLGEEKSFEVTTVILGEPGPEANVMLIASDVTESVLAQKLLEESEAKYRTIVETSHDAIISVNKAGEILYANRAVEPMFGLGAGVVVGRNVFSFVHPEDRERASSELTRDFKTGHATPNLGLRCVRADGETVFVEVNSGLVGWPGEETLEILVMRDVTERHRNEEERERRLKVEEALSAITSRFVSAGDAYEAIQGSLADLCSFMGENSRSYFIEFGNDGRTISRALEWSRDGDTTFSQRLLNLDVTRFENMVALLSAGEPVVSEDTAGLDSDLEQEFRSAFGVASIVAAPVFVGDSFRGVLGFFAVEERRSWSQQDVDLLEEIASTIARALERRDFVEELARSEKFRSRITESIGEGLAVLSNGVATWANSQMSELCGYSLEELKGKTLQALMPEPERFQEISARLIESLMEEGVFTMEDSLKRADGSLIEVQFSVTSLGFSGQEAGELLVAIKDVTESRRMRKEVEASAEAYSTLFSSAGDAFFVHTLNGNIIRANERAATYTGYPGEALLGMNMRDLVPQRLRDRYDDLGDILGREGALTFESRLRRCDETVLPVEATSRLTSIFGRTVVLSALRDISERKKAEEETVRRALQLAALNEIVKASTSSLDLDTALEAILRVTADVSKADAAMAVLGTTMGRRSARVMINTTGGSFHDGITDADLADLLTWMAAEHEGTLLLETSEEAGGKPGALQLVEALRTAGVEQALFMPLNSGEKSIGMIALGARSAGTFDERDIGFYNAAGAEIGVSIENAMIYRELTAEHERLSLLYRSAQSISGELELQSLLDTTAAEAARTVGADSALVGLIEPDSRALVFKASYNLDLDVLEGLELEVDQFLGGMVVSGKKTVLIPPKEKYSEEERKTFAKDPVLAKTGVDLGVVVPLIAGDKVLGVFALAQPEGAREYSTEDVLLLEAIGRQAGVAIQNARLYEETRQHLAALEKAHQELMVLDRMKSDFVSTVSHELRSPLAVIEGFAKTLSEHYDRIDSETKRDSIEIILKKSIALEGLIENILDMSRIEEGRLDVSREPFDLIELCREVNDDQERIDGLHELLLEAEDSNVVVVGDREKAEVALGNLVRNALKFSPEGGRVIVSVRRADGMAQISVSDEGIGIEPDEHERVFDRFYQVDSSETRSFPGSGLGLYITRELVQSMGGTIRLESAPGKGSVFTFTLPLERRPGETQWRSGLSTTPPTRE